MAENEEPQIYKKRYKVDKKLGAGNFGTAYLVTDLRAKQDPKVMKVVRLGEMDSEQTVDSVREAELLSNLDNEHIVKFHESFLENDCLCIVTEFCEGGDLDQRLKELKKKNQTLEEDQVVEWLIQILIAVQYMHKSRILHRDLKARNIFLKNNQVKIGDFGISRILVGTMDVATTFTGTPYYMSPEVMKHDGYEAKSDIWSVGCLLYEMCTYQHAFDGKGLMNVIYKVVEGKPPELPKKYSKELNDLLKKMFQKDPKNRPSAVQLLETPFLRRHRDRTHMTGPLENTINGNNRVKQINSRFENPINYGQMQKQKWALAAKEYAFDDEPEEALEHTLSNSRLNDEQEAEEEELTGKPNNNAKSAREALLERKIQAADARGQLFKQEIQSRALENTQSRQMMREKTSIEPTRQGRPLQNDDEDREQPEPNRGRSPNAPGNAAKFNPRGGPPNAAARGNHDDRPITPMRASYGQVASQLGEGDDSQLDFQSANDRSPTRGRDSLNASQISQRMMSASQRATMNSMSRTIDPRFAGKPKQENNFISSSRTIGSATRQRPPAQATSEDGSSTLRDNPNRDAYGPKARDMKTTALRMKAINALGEQNFETVYDYFVKQRTIQKNDSSLDDAKIYQGLTNLVKKTGDCFLVDQLVFLEML